MTDDPQDYDTPQLRKEIDITVKRGIKAEYDEELGLTGRNVHQVILRLARALEERDEKIKQLEDEMAGPHYCGLAGHHPYCECNEG